MSYSVFGAQTIWQQGHVYFILSVKHKAVLKSITESFSCSCILMTFYLVRTIVCFWIRARFKGSLLCTSGLRLHDKLCFPTFLQQHQFQLLLKFYVIFWKQCFEKPNKNWKIIFKIQKDRKISHISENNSIFFL